ncbi:MAG: ATP-NAD kinase family protein [Fretibacterium sp.]|nr:ATP-NAD kinase family protein [Fretibacterium sp.]
MKVGFLVNPIAGMGGGVALKGTDGAETLRRARELGAVPRAFERAALALEAASPLSPDVTFLACGGGMGAELLRKWGLPFEVVYTPPFPDTSSEDTRRAVWAMRGAGAALLLFAGGDGTARDVCAALEGGAAGERTSLPVIGVPAGVKIHSAVYGITPRRSGQLLRKFMAGQVRDYTQAEVMDIDEEAFREGRVDARLYGYLTVPRDRSCLQDRKSGGMPVDSYDRTAIGAWVAKEMRPGRLYLVGSGSTTQAVMDALRLSGTLLGVDAVKDRRLMGSDLTERQLLELVEPGNTTLIVTATGGQGHLLGRGNQQLSPAVLRAVGPGNIMVIATPEKLNGLFLRPLRVDTGDAELDRALCGYAAVVTGWSRRQMHRVAC